MISRRHIRFISYRLFSLPILSMLEFISVFSLNHIYQATSPLSRCDDPALHLLTFNSISHLPLIFERTKIIVGSNGPEHPRSITTTCKSPKAWYLCCISLSFTDFWTILYTSTFDSRPCRHQMILIVTYLINPAQKLVLIHSL